MNTVLLVERSNRFRARQFATRGMHGLVSMAMEPQSGLTLFNAIATAGKTIYDIAQGTSKLETKQQLMEVYDILMNLKREASELEDQNHDLKEKLRFKSDDFEFKNPFLVRQETSRPGILPEVFFEADCCPCRCAL